MMTEGEPSVVLEPVECDVCGQELGSASEYAVVTVVTDRTPRQLRSEHGGGFIENEWRLDPVCGECYERLEAWLFASPRSTADTLPAPPLLPVPSLPVGVEPHDATRSFEPLGDDDELAPFAAPAPNRS